MKVNTKAMEWVRAPKQYSITEDKVEIITEAFTRAVQRILLSRQHLQIWK